MFDFEPRRVKLQDGSCVLLRRFEPQDFPVWCEMIWACSPETIWKRFETHSKQALLARAEELCRPNPENQCILVAELEGRIVGEARLCLIPKEGAAEFCVLVADPWQGLGMGSKLTDLALEVARSCGVRRVLAEVVPENAKIIGFLERRGFSFVRDQADRVFYGEKRLEAGNQPSPL